MPVDAIVAEVQYAVLEPFDIDWIEAPVGDLGRGREPVNPSRLFGPERIRIVQRARIERRIVIGPTMGGSRESGRRRDALARGHRRRSTLRRFRPPDLLTG